MKFEKIGIVGQGFVGTAVREGLQNYFTILTHDKNGKCSNTLEEVVNRCKVIFLCLPTPMTREGKCHTGIIESVLDQINPICDEMDYWGNERRTIILKSTIPPGTTKRFAETYKHIEFVFNPEFLTEANAIDDYKNQTRIILGGENHITARVRPIFAKAFPKVKIIKTDSSYAEMVKYVTNSFLAMKVSFANEMYEICQYLNIDYDKVIEYAQHDDRLGYSHWNVPGPDGDFGYGGHCFPKDVKALMHVAMEIDSDVNPIMLQATDKKNNEVRKDRDWEGMEGRAVI
jgi:UDPglucose 6-dehydrogenase|tara:strand:+ start:755 stop:1615 length:861 start_codon:yes stop_codon:yes gene_type:complete